MIIKKSMIIIPDKVISKGKIFEIIKLDKDLWIKGFEIHLDENRRIEKVVLDGKHPNADPKTSELCLTEEIIGKPIEEVGIPSLYCAIALWNVDYCHFIPHGKFRVKGVL